MYTYGALLHKSGLTNEAIKLWQPLLDKDRLDKEALFSFIKYLSSIEQDAVAITYIDEYHKLNKKFELETQSQKSS